MKLGAAFASTGTLRDATALFHVAVPQLHGPAGPKAVVFTASSAQFAEWLTHGGRKLSIGSLHADA